ncbi:MAG: ACT domain-containing protein [Bifidobacteriaceae bacterium]|jgi:aspartate kinase|nr:ACT domain-containing protein [Bifidobacteriaceae bacterium]MCI1915060.1 ACT domain-containing protein [Bifidobacteriaceae bacterium]
MSEQHGGHKSASKSMGELFPDLVGPEAPVISGVAHDRSESQITLRHIPDRTGMAAEVFESLAQAGVNIDMIVQAGTSEGTADISFTIPESQIDLTVKCLHDIEKGIGFEAMDVDRKIGKISLVGVGMKTHSGITALFFKALAEEEVNVLMISTSEIRLSAVVALDDLDKAVRAVHSAFNLDSEKVEAVVYGGTGR